MTSRFCMLSHSLCTRGINGQWVHSLFRFLLWRQVRDSPGKFPLLLEEAAVLGRAVVKSTFVESKTSPGLSSPSQDRVQRGSSPSQDRVQRGSSPSQVQVQMRRSKQRKKKLSTSKPHT